MPSRVQDFVKLAEWEDRGYYSMRASAQKAQRQLHRLCRRADEALRQPSAAPLAAAAKAMGFADLSPAAVAAAGNASAVFGQRPTEWNAGKAATKKKRANSRAVEEGEALALSHAAEMSSAWSAFCGSLQQQAAAAAVAIAEGGDATSLRRRVPALSGRLAAVLSEALFGDSAADAGPSGVGESGRSMHAQAAQAEALAPWHLGWGLPFLTTRLRKAGQRSRREMHSERKLVPVQGVGARLPGVRRSLVQGLVGGGGAAGAAAAADALAGEAASRALALRALTEKGARARKKKALVDFLAALAEAGVSKRSIAVPADQRSVHSWFQQVSPQRRVAFAVVGKGVPTRMG
jgi:midasin